MAGIFSGDLVLELNGDPIYDKSNSLNLIQKVLTAHRGKITLAILPLKQSSKSGHRHVSPSPSNHNHRHHPDQNAKDLYAKVRAEETSNLVSLSA